MADRLLFSANRGSAIATDFYEKEELGYALTTAEQVYVKQVLSPEHNLRREGFEESEIRAKGLAGLIATGGIIAPSGSGAANHWKAIVVSSNQAGSQRNGTFYDMPDDYMYSIFEEVETDVADCNDVTKFVFAKVKPITHNEINRFRTNKYKRPYVNGNEGTIWRIEYSRNDEAYDTATEGDISGDQTVKRQELVTNGIFQVRDYFVRYLRIPPPIIVDFDTPANQRHCVLDEQHHEAIIELGKKILQDRTDRREIPEMRSIENLD